MALRVRWTGGAWAVGTESETREPRVLSLGQREQRAASNQCPDPGPRVRGPSLALSVSSPGKCASPPVIFNLKAHLAL